MSDEKKTVEPEAQSEEPKADEAPPMNRAERRAAAQHKKGPNEHPPFGRPFGSAGSFKSGTPNAPSHKRGAAHRKTGE